MKAFIISILCCLFSTWAFSFVLEGNQLAVNASDVHFYLWTRKNPDEYQILNVGDVDALKNSNYDHNLPTKIFAHGWNGGPLDGASVKMRSLERYNCNFLSVDWEKLAAGINYFLIVEQHVPIAGNQTAALVNFLIDQGSDLNRFHLIGFSLGSHVVGDAGASLVSHSRKLNRITGLDPAWPDFTMNDTDSRLDSSDAKFVDIIHTNSGYLIEGGLSFLPAIGHIDFYPNGGSRQPGCFRQGNDESSERSCNHGRAVTYYAESITTEIGFRAVECSSWEDYQNGTCSSNHVEYMGEDVPSTATGTYYLETNSVSPFAMG